MHSFSAQTVYFYPRPPRGGRRWSSSQPHNQTADFYPRPPRGGRPLPFRAYAMIWQISIHALREEGDNTVVSLGDINAGFLSTPSARRATPLDECVVLDALISIHALREEGDVDRAGGAAGYHISIHALREEGDVPQTYRRSCPTDFYPRPPRGGRPLDWWSYQESKHFYPRPPRGGRPKGARHPQPDGYFYPRPPRGGRPSVVCFFSHGIRFLSTPSARRATLEPQHTAIGVIISIHALREEGDGWRCTSC